MSNGNDTVCCRLTSVIIVLGILLLLSGYCNYQQYMEHKELSRWFGECVHEYADTVLELDSLKTRAK